MSAPLLRLEADLALPARATLGEGPVWDERAGLLYWVDILGRAVHRFDPASGEDVSFAVPVPVGAVGLDREGGLVLALADGFARCGSDGGRLERIGRGEAGAPFRVEDPAVRFNDGKVDPTGRFYAGTMAWNERDPIGALYVLEPDESVRMVLDGVAVSNGLAWAEDGRTLFYVDSPTGRVDRLDVDPGTGALTGRRVAFEIPRSAGVPDGMTMDETGCLWVALWDGGRICRYSPDGECLARVDLPVSHPTSVAFGGPRLTELFVTTARIGLSDSTLAAEPLSGGLFRCAAGVAGAPVGRFGA